jgi:hypothetical protein
VPVVAGMAIGTAFVVVVSLLSIFSLPSYMQPNDYVRIADNFGAVKAFVQEYPDTYVFVEEVIANDTNAKLIRMYYSANTPWNSENPYDVPAFLEVTMTDRGHPLVFIIICNSKDGTDYQHMSNQRAHVERFFERADYFP